MKRHALLAGVFLCAVMPATAAMAASPQSSGQPTVSWPSGNVLKTLVAKSKQSIEATFQSDGTGTAIQAVRDCYAHLKQLDWGSAQARCVTLDIAAYVHELHVPADFRKLDIENNSYIAPREFGARMAKYLPPPNGSFDEKNRYLTTIVHLWDNA